MKLTANQNLQLLWIHHHEPSHDIGLTVQDVVDLELTIVNQYDELSGEYFDKLRGDNKNDLVDLLMLNPSQSPFKEVL